MSSYAIAEILSDTIFILRVYEAYSIEDCVEPLPYKFFTVGVLKEHNIVELKGLNFDTRVCKEDFKAVLAECSRVAGHEVTLYWKHKNKEHFYPMKINPHL